MKIYLKVSKMNKRFFSIIVLGIAVIAAWNVNLNSQNGFFGKYGSINIK
jgi:thiamine biosynthesis protein ThiC